MDLKIFALYYRALQLSTFRYSTKVITACKFNLRYYFMLYVIKNRYVIAVHTAIY